jgi:hypothetical protein
LSAGSVREQGATSLGNWGHPDGAKMYRQPYDDESNILDSYGVSKQVSEDYINCKEILHEERPVRVHVIGGDARKVGHHLIFTRPPIRGL